MTRYRTKPQTVEAVQWRGDNEAEVIAFFGEGTRPQVFRKGSYLVKQGRDVWEFGADEFEARYEKIEPREENEGSD